MDTKKIVFLVEDDQDIREVVQEILTLRGYSVVSARDGQDAIERLRAGLRPNLILLDLMMPKMDGFEFRKKQAEEFPETLRTPAVLMSADRRFEKRLSEVSAQAFLAKPMDLSLLLRIVEDHLNAPTV